MINNAIDDSHQAEINRTIEGLLFWGDFYYRVVDPWNKDLAFVVLKTAEESDQISHGLVPAHENIKEESWYQVLQRRWIIDPIANTMFNSKWRPSTLCKSAAQIWYWGRR